MLELKIGKMVKGGLARVATWMVWQGMEEEDIKGQSLQRGVRKGELREEGDGLKMGVDRGGPSPLEEYERCMTVCIPGL